MLGEGSFVNGVLNKGGGVKPFCDTRALGIMRDRRGRDQKCNLKLVLKGRGYFTVTSFMKKDPLIIINVADETATS